MCHKPGRFNRAYCAKRDGLCLRRKWERIVRRERQRISIARCLLKGSSVMLVDEATAALDSKTAVAITNSILEIEGLTRIIVTHRLEESILRKYDKIFVLQNGNLIEQGAFDELMKEKGYFYSLYMVSQ